MPGWKMPQNWAFPVQMTGFPDEPLTGAWCCVVILSWEGEEVAGRGGQEMESTIGCPDLLQSLIGLVFPGVGWLGDMEGTKD